MINDKENNEIATAGEERSSKGFNLKHRMSAYKIAIIVIVVLAAIYLVSVYRNQHKARAVPAPRTIESPYKKEAGDGK